MNETKSDPLPHNLVHSPKQFGTAFVFLIIFGAIFLLHVPLLQLPFYWDEAGYYIPAARDLLLFGSLIPHSTPSNAHPPLVMAFLALCWKLFGYSIPVTRTAMLLIASFSLTGLFRLSKQLANVPVAVATVICTAVYPVFFAQSSLAHVDLAAAGLTFWALDAYFRERTLTSALWFCLAVMAKETAILAPLALFGWELLCRVMPGTWRDAFCFSNRSEKKQVSAALLLPLALLCAWYGYHYSQTGFIFGNPEFFRYNVQTTMRPIRIVLAFALRAWQTFGYLNLYLLTIATITAMTLSPVSENGIERKRVEIPIQFSLLAVILAYMLALAIIGGAVLARYMLPVVPLIILIGVATLRRRLRAWKLPVAVIVAAFAVALFVNPPHGFSMEDNLAYRDYILLHQDAENFLQQKYPKARVLTAWPANDELTRPYLGYVGRPLQVVRIENFSVEEIMAVADSRQNFDVALIFSTKYQAEHPFLERWRAWQSWKREFFGYHEDVPPTVAVQMLGGHIVYAEPRHGQWIAVIELDEIQEANAGKNILLRQTASK